MCVLHIDTTNNQEITVSLNGDSKMQLKEKAHILKSQALLPLIEKLLKKNKIELKDLSEIKVNRGPGSYTGIRIGLAVANALGYALGIRVNGKEMETDGVYEWPLRQSMDYGLKTKDLRLKTKD